VNNHIKVYSAFLLPMFLLTACASTKVVDEPPNNIIKTISTSESNVSLPYGNTTAIKLSENLSLNKVIKGPKGDTVVNKTIKISQTQFDDLIERVKNIDLSKLKPIDHPPLVGGRSVTLLIITDKGSYSFHDSYRSDFPRIVAQLYSDIDRLIPD